MHLLSHSHFGMFCELNSHNLAYLEWNDSQVQPPSESRASDLNIEADNLWSICRGSCFLLPSVSTLTPIVTRFTIHNSYFVTHPTVTEQGSHIRVEGTDEKHEWADSCHELSEQLQRGHCHCYLKIVDYTAAHVAAQLLCLSKSAPT